VGLRPAIDAGGWSAMGQITGGRRGMSENERRVDDRLTARDLVLRGAVTAALIVSALLALLASGTA